MFRRQLLGHVCRFFRKIFKTTVVSMEFLSELLMWIRILIMEMHCHKINLILGGYMNFQNKALEISRN